MGQIREERSFVTLSELCVCQGPGFTHLLPGLCVYAVLWFLFVAGKGFSHRLGRVSWLDAGCGCPCLAFLEVSLPEPAWTMGMGGFQDTIQISCSPWARLCAPLSLSVK